MYGIVGRGSGYPRFGDDHWLSIFVIISVAGGPSRTLFEIEERRGEDSRWPD